MTRWQTDDTPVGPSWPSIIRWAVLAAVGFAIVAYLWWGAEVRDAAGGVVWGIISGGALSRAVSGVIDRGTVQINRAVSGLDDETGTWSGPPNQPGAVLIVRWAAAERTHYILGWVSDNWQITQELRWPDETTLRSLVLEAEVDGLTATDDEATRSVRSRLMVLGMDRLMGIYPRGDRG